MSYLNNALIQLFDNFEEVTGYNFPDFMDNEVPDTKINQPFMQQYQNKNTTQNNGKLYKYLYDPNLQFGFRFHQRIAKIKFEDREQPWISIIFNTGEVKPLTNVLSHTYDQTKIVKEESAFYDVKVRRVLTPINLIFISNKMDYLYRYLQKLSFYFDRITQYEYEQIVRYSDDKSYRYKFSGMAKDILQKDLTKLDTERRGSLATAGFSFDLIYFDIDTPLKGYLLEDIDLHIRFVDGRGFLGKICMP